MRMKNYLNVQQKILEIINNMVVLQKDYVASKIDRNLMVLHHKELRILFNTTIDELKNNQDKMYYVLIMLFLNKKIS
jgi:hypothetical protein